jgi:hypothetical protein
MKVNTLTGFKKLSALRRFALSLDPELSDETWKAIVDLGLYKVTEDDVAKMLKPKKVKKDGKKED